MALVIKDRVKETTTTTGTGTFNLAGAVSGFEGFIQVGDGNTVYYVCTDNTSFEIGIGTFTDGDPDTLSRDTILQAKDVPNSTTDQKVDWGSGTRTIFCTYPADKAVFKDASNNINGTFVGNITGNVTGNAATATALETARTIGGVSFDGTGNINLSGVNTSGNQDTSGNAATATTLQTARDINGTSFNGSADITVTAAAGTLTGNTLNSTVTASSLTSLGTLASDLNVGGQDIINTGVSSADTHAGEYGSSSSPITFTVTVASKSGHPYQGDGSGLGYVINGVQAPALTLHGVDNVTSDSGYYYRFDQSDSSNLGHPLRFYLDADKSTAYNTGVTTDGTPGSSGAYTQINVDEDTPNILYYQCSQHAYMGNHAIVLGSNVVNHTEGLISFPTISAGSTTTLVGTGTTDTLTNKTIDVDNNTVSNIEVDNFKASAIVLESEGIGSNDNDTSLPTSAAVKDYVDTQITAEDLDLTTDSGTIAIDLDSETLTVTGGTGIDTSATSNTITIAGSNASTSSKGIASFSDTFFSVSSGAVSLDAAQTGITSVLNASLVIGRDADNDIDFSTDNQITFRANGADQIKLSDGALAPVTDNDIDLGTSSLEFKNAFFDGTVTADAFSGPLTGNVTGNVSGTAATVTGAAQSNITSLGTLTTLTVDNVAINGTTIGHTDDTDLITLADGAVTVAGDVTLSSTDSGSSDAPTLTLKRDSSSPANFDNQGEIKFLGENSASEEIKYGQIQVQASNVADGSEESRMVFSIFNDGADKEMLFLDANQGGGVAYLTAGIDLMFEGATSNGNETTLTVTDPTADRTITLPDATGTVITTGNTSDITTVGTLTTLTVDNVIINGSTIGHTGDTDLMTVASGVLTVAGEVDATSLDISGDADIDGTLEADAITVNGTALNTVIADEATALAIALG